MENDPAFFMELDLEYTMNIQWYNYDITMKRSTIFHGKFNGHLMVWLPRMAI